MSYLYLIFAALTVALRPLVGGLKAEPLWIPVILLLGSVASELAQIRSILERKP